jgi:hypothetical protein
MIAESTPPECGHHVRYNGKVAHCSSPPPYRTLMAFQDPVSRLQQLLSRCETCSSDYHLNLLRLQSILHDYLYFNTNDFKFRQISSSYRDSRRITQVSLLPSTTVLLKPGLQFVRVSVSMPSYYQQ